MDEDTLVGIVAAIFILVWVVLITSGITQACVNASWERQIVQHNCGEFYLDAEHNRQWRWK